MSDSITATKKLPLSVSLGINAILSEQEDLQTDHLTKFSLHDKKSFLFEQENFVLVSSNKIKRPKVSQPNPELLSLATQRALALKHYSNKAVLLVVNNRYEGELIIKNLNACTSCYKVYTSNPRIQNKIHKDNYAQFQNEADFIIITYTKLWEQVTNRNNPLTEQIVFVNPLTRGNILLDVAKIDMIAGCLHRHKCLKPSFSFFFDEALFPILTKKEYRHLTKAQSTIYFRCSEPTRSTYNNPFQEAIPNLSKNQYQLFILCELFRGRKTIKELLNRFQETFTYKLHLFSQGIFPVELNKQNNNFADFKKRIDLCIYANIVEQLNKWSKKYSKQMQGEVDIDFNLKSGEITSSNKITWQESEKTERFLPLISKKSDSKYYLSALGEAVLAASAFFGGVTSNFSLILRHLRKLLFRQSKTTTKLTVWEIIRFYLVLLGVKEEVVTHCLAQIPEQLDTEAKINMLVEYLKTEFKKMIDSYNGFCATKILGAFEQLMDTEAYLVFQQLKKKENVDEQSWEKRRRDAILLKANNQPLTVMFTANNYHMLRQQAKKLLENLVSEGRLICIQTFDNKGKLTYRYCTQELLDAYPFLQKSCGNCLWFRKRFKTCTFLRLQQAFNPSQVRDEYRTYANGKICVTATACGKHRTRADYDRSGKGTQFTLKVNELTKEMRKVLMSYISGTVTENVYLCFTCREPIAEFGTDSKLFFPKRRVSCSNCATLYLKKNNEKVTIRTEYRHLLRGLYYQETTSLPKILLEKDPTYAFVIYDKESLELDLNESNETSPDLLLCKQRIPLNKLQYLYFAGQRYKELERFLKVLAESDPEQYSYTIQRAEAKEKKNKQDAETTTLLPFTPEKYIFLKDFMTYLHKEGLMTQSFIQARTLSNIGAMLVLKEAYELMEHKHWRYDHKLYAMVDLLIRVNGGVKSSFYGSQLEGLSNIYFFDVLKSEAEQVGLWSWGRVNSRLVKDFFLSFSKTLSNAYSPYDAILNQLLRTFRAEINEIFRKVGLEPTELGPGLFHRRKTKSDIDRLGFYFDLIEPLRVLVLLTMSKAVREKTLNYNDCSFKLGERGQEIYRVKRSSQEKISELVAEALAETVFYQGAVVPFTQAFEQNLHSLRASLENCLKKTQEQRRLTKQEILQCFEDAQFAPMIYCPVGNEQQLLAIHKFAGKECDLFSRREEEILENKRCRETFRKIAMKKWLIKEPISGSKVLRVTKHQQREQDRSLVVLLLMLFNAHQRDFFFERFSTSYIRELLGLSQNQVQRILKQMVSRGLLLKEKAHTKSYYRLNELNASVKRLRLVLGLTLTHEEKQQRISVWKRIPLLERLAKVVSNIMISLDNQLTNSLWNNWSPPLTLQRTTSWMSEQITESKSYYESVGEI
jgi:DNA-binding Lrp family transcriptional regulator